MSYIEKPCIFLTSTGRTGTQFLGQNMTDMIQDCESFHEPDVLWLKRPGDWFRKIRSFGSHRMILSRFNVKNSIRTLNVWRHMGKISDEDTIGCLHRLRADFIRGIEAKIFVEANAAFNAFSDLLPKAFPNCKIVYIIRDPRDCVRSYMNVGLTSIYGPLDTRSWIPQFRLKAKYITKDPSQKRWNRMSHFEKLCWMWNRENTFAVQCIYKTVNARVFRFEDLFNRRDNYRAFHNMLQFATVFPSGFQAHYEFDPEVLGNKVHSLASGTFPKWPEWSETHVKQMHYHCQNLMDEFQYGTEPEWRRMVARTAEGKNSRQSHERTL
jgi:hypothetical protein